MTDRYKVVEENYIPDLESRVQKLSHLGYVPVGGIVIDRENWEDPRKGSMGVICRYYQAMWKNPNRGRQPGECS